MSFKNINDFDKQANKALEGKIRKALDKATSGDYTEKLKKKLVLRTQLGIGVDDQGNPFKLPALSENYKDQRKGKTRWITTKDGRKIKITGKFTPKLSANTKPSKANNTATGQLLNAITVVKTRVNEGIKFVFTIADNRSRDLYGKPNRTSNKKIVQYLKNMGRGFFNFSKAQRAEISREIRQILRGLLQ